MIDGMAKNTRQKKNEETTIFSLEILKHVQTTHGLSRNDIPYITFFNF